jgi:beta-glucosidase-like glycosyl hydrolase
MVDALDVDVDDLSLEEKVGQMLFARHFTILRDPRYRPLIERRLIGGIQANPVASEPFSRETLDAINRQLRLPLFVGSDAEAGLRVAGVKGTVLPSPAALGALGDERAAYDVGRITALELMAAGVNMVWGPVFDVNRLPDGVMALRCYGNTMRTTIPLALAVLRGYLEQGMIATAKHYPGGSSHSTEDNHIVSPEEGQNLAQARAWDLRIYRAAMEAGLNGIMTTHYMVQEGSQCIPATFSQEAIAMIRQAGFDGLIITDSLAMASLRTRWSNEECIRRAMAAGHDLLLVDYKQDPCEAFEMMHHAVRSGAVPEAQVNRSVARILREKRRLARVPLPVLSEEQYGQHQIFARQLAARTVTLRNTRPLDRTAAHLILYSRCKSQRVWDEVDLNSEQADFPRKLAAIFPNSELLTVSEWPVGEIERILRRVAAAKSLIVVGEAQSTAYRGTCDYSRPFVSLVRGVAHKISCFIHFGNPSAIRELPAGIANLLIAYSGETAEQAALDVLANPEIAQGKYAVPDGTLDQ